MRLKVLGCSGSQLPDSRLPSYLVNEGILLDAGSATAGMPLTEQAKLTDIFISHPHLDHVKDIFFLSDNLVELIFAVGRDPVNIHGLPEVLESLHAHLLNGEIWPDFTAIPQNSPVLALKPMTPGQVVEVDGVEVRAFPVDHGQAAAGFILHDPAEGASLAYTGDTGVTDAFWNNINDMPFAVDNLLVEVSFPGEMEQLAHLSKHLTPKLLKEELAKLDTRPTVYVTHMKATYVGLIIQELTRELPDHDIRILRQDEIIEL